MSREPLERRSGNAGGVELRTNNDGAYTIAGKIAYNVRSLNLGGFVEVIAPGAFTDSLHNTEVLAYWSHSSADILGRQSNGSLRVSDGPKQLTWECALNMNIPNRATLHKVLNSGKAGQYIALLRQ